MLECKSVEPSLLQLIEQVKDYFLNLLYILRTSIYGPKCFFLVTIRDLSHLESIVKIGKLQLLFGYLELFKYVLIGWSGIIRQEHDVRISVELVLKLIYELEVPAG